MNSPVKPPAVGHSITWGLFGHKLWEMGMARIQEARGRAAGSSLVLAAAAELEGWLFLQLPAAMPVCPWKRWGHLERQPC